MRHVVCCAAALAVLALPAIADDGIAADPATAARLAAHQQAFKALQSIQADVLTTAHAPSMRTVGRVVLRGADAYDREGFIDAMGTEHVSQESVLTADTQITLHHRLGVATQIDRARLRDAGADAAIPNHAHDILQVFAKAAPGSVQYLGPVAEDGETLDRFRMRAEADDEAPPGELLVWLHPTDGLPRRVELRSPGGRLLLERVFVNVKVNAPVPDALFVLAIPEDVEIHDLTDEYLAETAPRSAAVPADNP